MILSDDSEAAAIRTQLAKAVHLTRRAESGCRLTYSQREGDGKMKDNRDDPRFVGQTAGVIAMISALVKSLPPSNRKRLLRQTQVEFELLLGAMPAGTSQAQTEREVVEWMRDLFLKRIAETDSEQNPRRKPQAPKHAGQPGVSDKRSEVLAPPPTGVDIEL